MKTLDELIEDSEVKAPPARVSRQGIAPVIVLSVLLGVLMTVVAVGAYLHYQTSRALEAQLLAVEDELRSKSLALDEMTTQIRMLSRHVQILKEYAIARSRRADEDAAKPAAQPPDASSPAETKTKPEPAARSKKSAATTADCAMAGKSPAQQAAARQRCVGLAEVAGDKAARR